MELDAQRQRGTRRSGSRCRNIAGDDKQALLAAAAERVGTDGARRRRRAQLPAGLLPARRRRRPGRGRARAARRGGRPRRPSSPRTGRRAGPWSGSGRAATAAARPGRGRDRHRHRRHAVPGRLGHHGAGQARPVGPPGRPPAAARPPGRHRRAARGARAWSTATTPSHDELAESWTHIEIARLADGEVEPTRRTTCSGCSATSGSRSRTGTRMRARAVQLAEELSLAAGEAEPDRRAAAARSRQPGRDRRRCCAGWPTVTSRSSATGSTTWRTGRTGWRCAPCPAPASASCGTTRQGSERVRRAAARGPGPGPLDPQRLIVTKANSRSTVHRPSYLDYVAVKRLDAGRRGDRRVPVPRPVHPRGLHREHHQASRCCGASWPTCSRASGLAADSHDGKDVAEVLEFYPREELFMTSVPELAPVAAGVLRLRERTPDPAVPAQGRLRPVHVLPGLPAPGPLHHPGQAARAGDPARGAGRRRRCDYSVLVGESPVARLHIVVRAERGQRAARRRRGRAGASGRRRGPVLGRRPGRGGRRQLGEQRARALLRHGRGDQIPRDLQDRRARPSAAVDDLAKILELRESGEDVAFELWESQDYVGGVPIEEDQAEAGAPGATRQQRVWRLTIYRTGAPITLTDVLPRLQHMGVDVVDEHPYEFPGARAVLDLRLRPAPERDRRHRLARAHVHRVGQGAGRGRAGRAVARRRSRTTGSTRWSSTRT